MDSVIIDFRWKLESLSIWGFQEHLYERDYIPYYLSKWSNEAIAQRHWLKSFAKGRELDNLQEYFRSGLCLEICKKIKEKEHRKRKQQRTRRGVRRKNKKLKQQTDLTKFKLDRADEKERRYLVGQDWMRYEKTALRLGLNGKTLWCVKSNRGLYIMRLRFCSFDCNMYQPYRKETLKWFKMIKRSKKFDPRLLPLFVALLPDLYST
jgi:hypothetical protein